MELCDQPFSELNKQVTDGKISPDDIISSVLTRIEDTESTILNLIYHYEKSTPWHEFTLNLDNRN